MKDGKRRRNRKNRKKTDKKADEITDKTADEITDKRLIILDVNGLLCKKLLKTDSECDKILKYYGSHETLELERFFVFIRPHVREFITKCYSYGTVGFWSSTKRVNAEPILKHILTKSQYEKSLFRWYRDKTKSDPETSEFATVKIIQDLFDSEGHPKCYGFNNTVICDDESSKLRHNPENNSIVFRSFDPCDNTKEDDNTKEGSKGPSDSKWVDDLYGMIIKKFENLN